MGLAIYPAAGAGLLSGSVHGLVWEAGATEGLRGLRNP